MLTVYSSGGCRDCQAVKTILKNNGLEFEELLVEEGSNLTDLLDRAPGIRSTPQVFDGDHHIGGLKETWDHVKTLKGV